LLSGKRSLNALSSTGHYVTSSQNDDTPAGDAGGRLISAEVNNLQIPQTFDNQLQSFWHMARGAFPNAIVPDLFGALNAAWRVNTGIKGRHCGDLGDKVSQYLSVVQFARATGSRQFNSLEIGTLFGGSCLVKLFAMKDLGISGKVVCINPMSGFYGQEKDPFSRLPITAEVFFGNMAHFGFSHDQVELRQCRSDQSEAVAGLPAFGTLMIDGDHSFAGVEKDLEIFSSHLADYGVLLFDDYAEKAWPDITRFVDTLRKSPPVWLEESGILGTTICFVKRGPRDNVHKQDTAADKNKDRSISQALHAYCAVVPQDDVETFLKFLIQGLADLASRGIINPNEAASSTSVQKGRVSKKTGEEKSEALTAVHTRANHAHFDESMFILELMKRQPSATSLLVDVGGHHGGTTIPFAEAGFRVHAFEPDPNNRKKLLEKATNFPLVSIDPRAVSDHITKSMPFFTSDESTGISSLSPFRDSHRESCLVNSTTISAYCEEHRINNIDFLKIDTEGYDFMVLKGVPWEKIQPSIILCEFEDSKTVPLGYDFHSMAQFLVDKGYKVFVSEWHPIIRYGITHDWCRLVSYPCDLLSPNAWGNLIAFKKVPEMQLFSQLANSLITFNTSKSPINVPAKTMENITLQERSIPGRERHQNILDYKDKHRGQRCVIIGNGPSLGKMDLSFLEKEICFGMNRIFLLFDRWKFRPTYYASVNPLVIEQSAGEILKINAPKFLSSKGIPFFSDPPADMYFIKSHPEWIFSHDPQIGLCEGWTVTYFAMQLAYFMGFSEVILIGVDHHFVTPGDPNKEVVSQGDDPNHFHPEYFGKGTRWNLPDLDRSEHSYRMAKAAFESVSRKIIDATLGGKLTIFPKVDYKQYFSGSDQADADKGIHPAASIPSTDSNSIRGPLVVRPDNRSSKYLVTALVSTYNSERFLKGCLQDLEAQTIADKIEIIVIDSASQQNEKAIVQEFQKRYRNIKYLRTAAKEPVYAAWNRGIMASSGKYITNANTDDRHRKDAFAIMVKELEDHQDIGLVYADVIITKTENQTFEKHTPVGGYTWYDWDRAILLGKGCFMGPQPMWRRSVHDFYGLFDESMVTSGDYEFWLRISQTMKFHHIKQFLGLYLDSPASIEHSNRGMQSKENGITLARYQSAAREKMLVRYLPFEQLARIAGGDRDARNDLASLINLVAEHADIPQTNQDNDAPWTQNDEVLLNDSRNAERTIDEYLLLTRAMLNNQCQKYAPRFIEVATKLLLGRKKQPITPGLTSIIVMQSGELRPIKQCIESIKKHTTEPYEIIIVASGSKNAENTQKLKNIVGKKSALKLLERPVGASLAKSINDGVQASSGEYLLVLDQHVVVSEGWLTGMFKCLRNSPDAGIIGPLTNGGEGQQLVANADLKGIAHLDGFARDFKERNLNRRVNVGSIAGFCMLFRSDLIGKIGLFDETLESDFFAAKDFCQRTRLQGLNNYIAGDVFVQWSCDAVFHGSRRLFDEKWRMMAAQDPLGTKLHTLKALEQAADWYNKDQLDKAISALMDGITKAPDEKAIYWYLVEILIDAKRFQDALDAGNSLPDESKNDLRTLELIGYCKEGLGRDDEAKEQADRVLELNPGSSSALNLKGVLAYKKGDKVAAESFFAKAIEADPGYGEPYTNIGMLMWAAGQQENALSYLERGFLLSPTTTDIITAYHTAITTTGSLKRAEQLFQDAKALHPQNRKIAFLLIDLLIKQENYMQAMREIEQAMILVGIDDGILAAALEVRHKIGPLDMKVARKNEKSLSISMIVKNEEQFLAKCLMSVKPIANEMVVVDTGSNDRTKDIARAFGAKVFDFAWTQDFSAARNCALSHASGDWIFVMDADEVISEQDYPFFVKLLQKAVPPRTAYSFNSRNYTNSVGLEGWMLNDGQYYKESAGTGWVPSRKVRLFPRDESIRFENPVHELIEPSIAKKGFQVISSDVPIHHYGRLNQEKLMVKHETYYQLGLIKLKEKGHHDIKALTELAVQAAELKKYDEALELWNKILEQNPNDALAYYNIGGICLTSKRYDEALVASRKAVELQPDRKAAVTNYALSELLAGNVANLDAILRHLPDVHAGNIDFPIALGLLAVTRILNDDDKSARRYFDRLRTMDFNVIPFVIDTSTRLIACNRIAHAKKILDGAIACGYKSLDIERLSEECRRDLVTSGV
jgi:FkbM family methyltransferase